MLGFGALCEFPLADYGFTGTLVSVSLPPVSFGLAAPAIGIQAGKNINLPPPNFTLSAPAIGVLAGKRISLPPLAFTLTAPALFVGTGIAVSLPPVSFALAVPPIWVAKSAHVNLANSFDVTHETGALGEGPLASHPIGAGDPFVVSYKLPVRFTVSTPAIGIQAGKNVNLPPPGFTFTAKVPEIGARRRKLRIHTIAS